MARQPSQTPTTLKQKGKTMRTIARQANQVTLSQYRWRNLLLATLTSVALLASALAALSQASPAQGQQAVTALDAAGCTDGTFIHSGHTRVTGSNNDIFDDCESLVAIQNALAAQTANNSLAQDHPLRLWGTASQQKLTPRNALFSLGGSYSTWGGVSVGKVGTVARITGLRLSGIQSSTLPSQLGNLTSITWLNLNENSFTTLPTQIGSLTNLTQLYLEENSLTTLPATIGDLTNLTRLDLEANSLTALPTQIGSLTRLTHLHLHGNNLTSLPASIGNLTNLVQLWLHENSLTTLPATIGNLTSLTNLDLDDNNLTTLPATIGNLANLTRLDITSNSLAYLPTQIGNLRNLLVLYIHTNSLTSLPAEFGRLSNLQHLDVSGNQLTSFSPLTDLLRANGGRLYSLKLCSNSFSGTIPKALFETKNAGGRYYVLRDRPPDHCWTLSHETSWDVVSVTSTIDSPDELAGNLGLSPDIGLYWWNAVDQLWTDIDLVSSLAEGEAIAYRGRGLVSEDTLTSQNLGVADENVTVTLRHGWNVLKPPEVASGTPSGSGISLFDDSLLDCSSISGSLVTATFDLDSLTWKLGLPCHQSILRQLEASSRISTLTGITANDALYIYFISALPVSVTWNTTTNKYEPSS